MEGLHSTTDSEVDLVTAAKQARNAAARPGSKPAPPGRSAAAPAGPASSKAAAAAIADSDSDGDFNLIAAAKRSSAAATRLTQPSAASPGLAHSRTPSNMPQQAQVKAPVQAPAQAPARQGPAVAPSPSKASVTAGAGASSDSEVDMIALAKRASRQAAVAEPASAASKGNLPPSPNTGAQHTPKQPLAQSAVPGGPPAVPTLQELAAGALPGEHSPLPASPLPASGAPHVVMAPSVPASPAVAVPLASLAGLGDVMEGLRSDIGRMEQGWQQHWSAQQANTADLRCRLDGLHAVTASQAQEVTGRLQGMAAELEAQRSRLDAVEARQAQRAQQGPPCTSPAEGTAATAPGDCGNAALPPSAAAAAATPPSSGREASNPSGATVDHIMRRLSLLESRVGSQLQQIEDACAPASPRSAPISPLKSGLWAKGPFAPRPSSPRRSPSHRTDSRAAQAAAVAAALVYGAQGAHESPSNGPESSSEDCEVAQLGWAAYAGCQASLPGSPRILAGGLARPASAAAACCDGRSGLRGRRVPLGTCSGPATKRSRAVELQVAETHAIISGIQNQIAAIKGSLARAGGELEARQQEVCATALRLEQLERTDRRMAKVEAANLAGACALERRVRGLEEAVASAGRQAAAGGVLARETSAALRALEWRVDQSADATIGTFKALEARVDKHRSELGAVAATATLADAKAATLAAEVARLQRRMHGGTSLGGTGGKVAATFRVY